jgi:hypothetical protein
MNAAKVSDWAKAAESWPVGGREWVGDESLGGEDQQGWNQHEPEPAADASGCGAARCLQPQGVLQDRPAQRAPLTVDEQQHELPDQADRYEHEKGARQG